MSEGVHPGSWLGDSVEEYKKLPTWGKVAAGGAVALVAFFGYRAYVAGKNGQTVNGALSNGQVASGQSVGGTSGGLQSPFGQVPSGSNAGSVPVLPAGLQPVFDGVGSLIGWQPSPDTSSGSPLPTQTPSLIEQIRARFSQPDAASYDSKYAGVPERSTPGGKVVDTLGFGSTLQLANLTPVSGPSNFGGTSGSSLWYKLPNGNYVSTYDVAPPVQPVYNSTQAPPIPKAGA